MAKKPTFHDIAKLARVSQASVSRVAAGNLSVDVLIKKRVQQAAAQLGVNLDKKRDESNRVVVFAFANREVLHSFHSRVLVGAENFISDNGWEIVFLSYRYSPSVPPDALHLPQLLNRRTPARGVILAGFNSPNLLKALSARNVPYSVLGNNLLPADDQVSRDTVWSDDLEGARDQTRYLLSLGHRDIWFLGNTTFPWFTRCREGYARAMSEAGQEARMCDLHADGNELGYLGTKSILSREERVTAIFAGSDEVAGGVYLALREANLSVPGDISVVGFNDSLATNLHPTLTSVREFPEKLGRHLAEFTLNRIKNPGIPPQKLTIPTQLIIRASVAPPSTAAGATPAESSSLKPTHL